MAYLPHISKTTLYKKKADNFRKFIDKTHIMDQYGTIINSESNRMKVLLYINFLKQLFTFFKIALMKGEGNSPDETFEF